jgi:hypothetical protein
VLRQLRTEKRAETNRKIKLGSSKHLHPSRVAEHDPARSFFASNDFSLEAASTVVEGHSLKILSDTGVRLSRKLLVYNQKESADCEIGSANLADLSQSHLISSSLSSYRPRAENHLPLAFRYLVVMDHHPKTNRELDKSQTNHKLQECGHDPKSDFENAPDIGYRDPRGRGIQVSKS